MLEFVPGPDRRAQMRVRFGVPDSRGHEGGLPPSAVRFGVPTNMQVWVRGHDREGIFERAQALEVSESGLALYTSDEAALSPTLDLTLRLSQGRYVSLRARRVWSREAEEAGRSLVGMRFEGVPASVERWLCSHPRMQIKAHAEEGTQADPAPQAPVRLASPRRPGPAVRAAD